MVRFLCLLAMMAISATAMEVYLRELTVFTSHESSFLSDKPEVYFDCEDDRLPVLLREVVEVDKKYSFGPEQIPATHLGKGECVLCTLKEFDILSEDDVYGKMRLCADNFGTGVSEVKANGEFHARFECPECKKGRWRESTEANCLNSHSSADAVVNGAMTYTESTASASAHSSSSGGKKSTGVSPGAVVFITLLVFAVGVIVGGVALKFASEKKHQRVEARTHELNSILSQTDVLFEALPKNGNKTGSRSRSGIATYQPLPSDDAQQQ